MHVSALILETCAVTDEDIVASPLPAVSRSSAFLPDGVCFPLCPVRLCFSLGQALCFFSFPVSYLTGRCPLRIRARNVRSSYVNKTYLPS